MIFVIVRVFVPIQYNANSLWKDVQIQTHNRRVFVEQTFIQYNTIQYKANS